MDNKNKIPFKFKTPKEKEKEYNFMLNLLVFSVVFLFLGFTISDFEYLSMFIILLGWLISIIFSIRIYIIQFRTGRIGWFVASLVIPFAILFYFFGVYGKFLKDEKTLKEVSNIEEEKTLTKEDYEKIKKAEMKDNKDFMKFLRDVVIVLGFLIIVYIFYRLFF